MTLTLARSDWIGSLSNRPVNALYEIDPWNDKYPSPSIEFELSLTRTRRLTLLPTSSTEKGAHITALKLLRRVEETVLHVIPIDMPHSLPSITVTYVECPNLIYLDGYNFLREGYCAVSTMNSLPGTESQIDRTKLDRTHAARLERLFSNHTSSQAYRCRICLYVRVFIICYILLFLPHYLYPKQTHTYSICTP
jgi:hypothetical protein